MDPKLLVTSPLFPHCTEIIESGKKICVLGPNLQQLALKPTAAQLTICYLVIMFCLNPHLLLFVLAGQCWLINLLMDGSTVCDVLSVCCLNIQPDPPSR